MGAPKKSEADEASRFLQENVESVMIALGAVGVSLDPDTDARDLNRTQKRIERAVAAARVDIGIFTLWTVLSKLCEPIAANLREKLSPDQHARLLSKLAEISPGATPPGSIH